MTKMTPDLATVRRQYGALALHEDEMNPCPLEQTKAWLAQAVEAEAPDPTAMVLSTIDTLGHPDARIVLLKEIQINGFVFFTDYHSTKGQQINANPFVALTFYWSVLARQIRIKGAATPLEEMDSLHYFSSRPYLSQLSACASIQSQVISSREQLEEGVERLKTQYPEGTVPCPTHWGGYLVRATEFEFWQGRDNRLHDRVRYSLQNNKWGKQRLSP